MRDLKLGERLWWRFAAWALLSLLAAQLPAGAADAGPPVRLDATGVQGRPVEPLTQQSVARSYGLAWQDLAGAVQGDHPESRDSNFTGAARTQLAAMIADQESTGVRTSYTNQRHQLKAVFYSPEGDVIELHDTMECDLQLSDGGKVIHQEHAVLRYVVLMTPGADRWLVRQLQAVAQF